MSIKSLEKQEIFNGYSDCLKEIGVFLMSRIELERYFDFLSLKKSNVFCFYKERVVLPCISLIARPGLAKWAVMIYRQFHGNLHIGATLMGLPTFGSEVSSK